MKLCKNCILPETFPGIKFDDAGICNHCRREASVLAKASEKKKQYRQKFEELILETKGRAPAYDVIMAYSGGKDSTFTLKLLRERYDLRILAFTFDNHFVSSTAWENIKKVTDTLGIDHINFRPSWILIKDMFSLTAREDIFAKPTLLRASSICTACIGLVKGFALKTALEKTIPLVAFGWSPGQAPIQSAIMKNNPDLISQNQTVLLNALAVQENLHLDRYFLPEFYYERFRNNFPYNIHPLAFFKYDEREIISTLDELGWKNPTDTDTNSSNCLINAFANHCHLERHGFHPYVWEMANMVRQGVMERHEGIEKIYTSQDQKMVEYAKIKLGL